MQACVLQQNRVNFHPLLFKDNIDAFLSDVVPRSQPFVGMGSVCRVQPHKRMAVDNANVLTLNATHQFDVKR